MNDIKLQHKRIKLNLVGIDGNAYSIMGHYRKAAQKQGVPKDKIDAVLNDAMSDDYNHLLGIIDAHCE